MQALFAQQVPAGGFVFFSPLGIVNNLLGLVALVCFILIVIKMFQHGQVGIGIVTIITAFCGIGFIIALVYGWMKAKDWNLQTVMLVYTVAFIVNIALGGYVYSTMVVVPQ